MLSGYDLERLIVAMLLSVEGAPAEMEQPRQLGTQQAADPRIAVRHMDAGDLVVALVLEPAAAGEAGIDGRGGIAAQRQDAHRLIGWVAVAPYN